MLSSNAHSYERFLLIPSFPLCVSKLVPTPWCSGLEVIREASSYKMQRSTSVDDKVTPAGEV